MLLVIIVVLIVFGFFISKEQVKDVFKRIFTSELFIKYRYRICYIFFLSFAFLNLYFLGFLPEEIYNLINEISDFFSNKGVNIKEPTEIVTPEVNSSNEELNPLKEPTEIVTPEVNYSNEELNPLKAKNTGNLKFHKYDFPNTGISNLNEDILKVEKERFLEFLRTYDFGLGPEIDFTFEDAQSEQFERSKEEHRKLLRELIIEERSEATNLIDIHTETESDSDSDSNDIDPKDTYIYEVTDLDKGD